MATSMRRTTACPASCKLTPSGPTRSATATVLSTSIYCTSNPRGRLNRYRLTMCRKYTASTLMYMYMCACVFSKPPVGVCVYIHCTCIYDCVHPCTAYTCTYMYITAYCFFLSFLKAVSSSLFFPYASVLYNCTCTCDEYLYYKFLH